MHHSNYGSYAYARSCASGTGVRDPRGASPLGVGVPQAPSCVGVNIVCEQDKLWCISPKALSFILNHCLC
jgi:hypothetical protein